MLLDELPIRSPKNQRIKRLRGFLRKVRAACRDVEEPLQRTPDEWCNLAHIHLDWHGYGDYSRQARSLFIHAYAKRFDQFAKSFMSQEQEFQLWILIHPYDSGSDCLFYHTPNPHSKFPAELDGIAWHGSSEHMFTNLLPGYEMIEGQSDYGPSLFYYAKGVGTPLA